jgi:hypothetical protein
MELLKKCWNQKLSPDYFLTEFKERYSKEEKMEIICKFIKLFCSDPLNLQALIPYLKILFQDDPAMGIELLDIDDPDIIQASSKMFLLCQDFFHPMT